MKLLQRSPTNSFDGNLARRVSLVVLLLGYRCFRSMEKHHALRYGATHIPLVRSAMVPLLAVLLGSSLTGHACPHEESDHRLLGQIGCPIQRKSTIEDGCPLRTICSFHPLNVSVKIDPKHPYSLITRSQEILAVPDGLPLGCQTGRPIFSPPLRSRGLRGRCESKERIRSSVQVRFEGTRAIGGADA